MPLVSESAGLAHVQQAAEVTRSVTDKKTGEVKTGIRIFLSSIAWEPGRQACLRIGRLVRSHWVVENNIHWLRDGVWKEDTCRSRGPNAACALALLRTALLRTALLRTALLRTALLRTALLAPLRASGRTSLTTALEAFAENKVSAVTPMRNQRLA